MQYSLVVLAALACTCTAAVGPLNLTLPNVNIDTDYTVFYNATLGRNVTSFEAFRINSVLAWGLQGDNAASPGGEIGFITEEYGQTTGYVLRYCVEVMLPEGYGYEDLQHGNNGAFASYECCGGGSCGNCGYTGSGTDPNPNMVGRSYNLDTPNMFATGMAKEYGWWYSFNNAGYCSPDQALGTNGCVYRASPYVNSVKLQDVNSMPDWTNSPANWQQYQTINNMLINAFNTDLMTSFTYDPTANKYTQVNGRVRADPTQQCRVACGAGTYSASGYLAGFASGGSITCKACPVGTYTSQTGSRSCQQCPKGTTTNQVGAVSSAACFGKSTPKCQPGTYNEYTGHAPCTPCPAGYYQTAHSATTCTACPAFTTSNAVGASSASTCVLPPPQAQLIYEYSETSYPGPLNAATAVASDIPGAVNLVQQDYYGYDIATTGSLSIRCVESVNVPPYTPPYSCFGSYCNYQNPTNLPVKDTSPIATAQCVYQPNGTYTCPSNGNWIYYPPAGECTTAQLPGQGGCTWKASTVAQVATMDLLTDMGLYSCSIQGVNNPNGYCYSLTNQQWANSTYAISKMSSFAYLNSTVSTSTGTVMGPLYVQNGKCMVDCPSGYTFRSAFTAPYCVPTSSVTVGTFLANEGEDVDVEVAQNLPAQGYSSTAVVVGGAVAVVALVALGAVVGALFIVRRNRRGYSSEML